MAEQFSQGFNSLPARLPGAGGVTPQPQPEPWYSKIFTTILGPQYGKVAQNIVTHPLQGATWLLSTGLGGIVLPEVIRSQFQGYERPVPIEDWTRPRPGVYVGYRAHIPESVESQHTYGGTFSTRSLPFAQEIAEKSVGEPRTISQVGVIAKNPLHISVPEHKALLVRVAKAVEAAMKTVSDKIPYVQFRKDVEKGYIPQMIPDPIKAKLRALGYDAIIAPAEAEGQYPTIASLEPGRTLPIQPVTPRYTQTQLAAYYLRQYPGVYKTEGSRIDIPPEALPGLVKVYNRLYGPLPEPHVNILDDIPIIRNRLIRLFREGPGFFK